jgi:hypothetical protein
MATPEELLGRLAKLERLLSQANIRESVPIAHAVALSIALEAPTAGIADLASKVIASVSELNRNPGGITTEDIPVQKALWRLRLALGSIRD